MEKLPIIQTFGITKVYGNKKVLDNVSITVNRGDIYGFVGRNGAGKTTLIRILCNLVFPSEGSYALDGISEPIALRKVQKKVASMVETPALYLDFTGEDNIKTRCILFGVEPTKEIIESSLTNVGLGAIIGSGKIAKDYSLGMKQRLGIAMALMGNPEILLLDEPTNGLDPDGIREIRELLLKINKEQGVTILVSSHILGELSKLATRFGIIEKGILVREITNEQLNKLEGRVLHLVTNESFKLAEKLKAQIRSLECTSHDNELLIHHVVNVKELVDLAEKTGIEITDFYTVDTGLEDYFIRTIGEVK